VEHRAEVVADIHAQFLAQGRMSVPPDHPPSDADEQAFWDEVDVRLGQLAGPDGG
jgi:hypothetical protein